MWIAAALMLVEIVAGWYYNSMALMADGFHMSSHAKAIGGMRVGFWRILNALHERGIHLAAQDVGGLEQMTF